MYSAYPNTLAPPRLDMDEKKFLLLLLFRQFSSKLTYFFLPKFADMEFISLPPTFADISAKNLCFFVLSLIHIFYILIFFKQMVEKKIILDVLQSKRPDTDPITHHWRRYTRARY